VAALAWWRSLLPQSSALITLVMFLVVAISAVGLYVLGRRHQWLIALEHPVRLAAGVFARVTRKRAAVLEARDDR
jgi:membrane protein YdbS with pleckstrin-like domain